MRTLRRGAVVCGVELQHPAADMPNAWIVLCGCGDECFVTLFELSRAIEHGRQLKCWGCAYKYKNSATIRYYRGTTKRTEEP